MTSRGLRLVVGAGACALGLLVAGCERGGGGADPDGGGGRDVGPLAEFFGWHQDHPPQARMREAEARRQRRLEDLVADCMAERGFEYLPRRPDGGPTGGGEEVAAIWALQREDPERFAREYGYGMSTMPEMAAPGVGYEDPNQAVRDALSPSDREAYDRALWGRWPQTGAGEAAGDVEPGDPGCYSEAAERVYGPDDDDPSRWEDINQRMSALYERIDGHPRVREATRAWSDCMAEAGYPDLDEVYAGQDLVNERMGEVHGWDASEALGPTPGPAPTPDPAALAALRDYERDVASADHRCRRDHYDPVHGEVRDELESRFIEEHRAELTAYRDWLDDR